MVRGQKKENVLPGLPPTSAFERNRQKNIEENNRLLRELGLLNNNSLRQNVEHPAKAKPKTLTPRSGVVKKRSRISQIVDEGSRRRSARLEGKIPIAYSRLGDDDEERIEGGRKRARSFGGVMLRDHFDEDVDVDEIWSQKPVMTCKELYRFEKPPAARDNIVGHVPGVPVGFLFYCREEASWAGVHRGLVQGIHGNEDGAYSVVLNGGYEDDVDHGDCFVLTGSGGRNLKGTSNKPKNLRTAPQSSDQELSGKNLSLSKNVISNNPVRVLRGYKLNNEFAPERGFRYDGLYKVVKYDVRPGMEQFLVYRFYMQRIPEPGQDVLPWNMETPNCKKVEQTAGEKGEDEIEE